jgi:hypothetical protein
MAVSTTATALELDQKTIVPMNPNTEQPVDPCEVVQCYSSEIKYNSDTINRRNIDDNHSKKNVFELKNLTNMNEGSDERKE